MVVLLVEYYTIYTFGNTFLRTALRNVFVLAILISLDRPQGWPAGGVTCVPSRGGGILWPSA